MMLLKVSEENQQLVTSRDEQAASILALKSELDESRNDLKRSFDAISVLKARSLL